GHYCLIEYGFVTYLLDKKNNELHTIVRDSNQKSRDLNRLKTLIEQEFILANGNIELC
ncbi:unnamed protein product, partial [Adineta steineri]